MGNMSMRAMGELIVVAHNTQPPSHAEWEEFLDFFRHAADNDKSKVLVFTEGAAPDTMQRAALNKALAGKAPRIAVVSPSRVVRGVATAISWFNPHIDVFSPDETAKALDHLAIPDAERVMLLDLGAELRHAVGSLRSASSSR